MRIILAFAAFLLFTVTPDVSANNQLLIIGDSLAKGAFATTADRSYVQLLDGTYASAGDLSAAETVWATQRAKHWPVIVLEIGINDTLKEPVTLHWSDRYATLASDIVATGAKLICVTPFDIGVAEFADDLADRANTIRDHCIGGHVADLYSASIGRSELHARIGEPTQYNDPGMATDEMHPNDLGHVLITQLIHKALRSEYVFLPSLFAQSDMLAP